MTTTKQFLLRPESELLLWCARTTVTQEFKERIRQRVQGSLEWGIVLDLARYHGVGPLLCRNLSTLCSDLVPAESLTRLRQRTHAGALLNRVLAQELVVLCEAFAAHGVPVIPIKGPTLAASVYGDLTLREFSDLDLLVPKDSIAEAQPVLLAQGYERADPSSDGPYHVFLKKHTLCRVDLQSVMQSEHFMFQLDRPEFWQRRTAVQFANKTVQGLAPEDLLIVLCVHGSKHAWEALKWVCDVAELLRTYDHLDWNQVFSSASRWRCRRLVYMGLSLAHRVLDAPLPEAVLARIYADSDVQMFSHRMPSSLLADRLAGVGEAQAVALHFSLKDSWWERWRFGLMLCLYRSPMVTTTPAWFRWHTSLSRFARLVSLLHWIMKILLPSTIRGAINRWVQQHSG
ncbi:MAG TPA: nucleotidyltransferase family protein [Nitrospiraceae bacterium]|jgi:hypothetical protein